MYTAQVLVMDHELSGNHLLTPRTQVQFNPQEKEEKAGINHEKICQQPLLRLAVIPPVI